ncbi:uncharacterized protein LY89DRAFT_761925 [Mollisia scopiformis]|uniref:Uncharacterized protein n=1 Tax=Mollisia scopiformis TaxID=149040 RepID=A0A132BAD8_MOLSC|nr:uncharacterized protein LY89DRAFT_761925 [Mollisia scopiformis]KUJ09366.1 hypothetical protein LY89DRAFT_761925 [Mollisia scopiformis]
MASDKMAVVRHSTDPSSVSTLRDHVTHGSITPLSGNEDDLLSETATKVLSEDQATWGKEAYDTWGGTIGKKTYDAWNVPMGFPWEALPYELREKMFEDVTSPHFSSWKNLDFQRTHLIVELRELHPLVVAMRGFQLTGMNKLELAGVRKLYLNIGEIETTLPYAQFPQPHWAQLFTGFRKPKWFTDYFLLNVANVQEVTIVSYRYHPSVSFISEFPFWLQGFKNLKLLEVWIPTKTGIISAKRRKGLMRGLKKRVLRKMGVEGVASESEHVGLQPWTWEASEGQSMDWSQEIGWPWNLPYRQTHRNKKRTSKVCYELSMNGGGFILKSVESDESHEHSNCPFPYWG